ncbi:MAG TPA: helix-turn-helix domain-containing protein [Sulfuriferula sp.]|nr:helix-turn-helix domain-containing protein [Sulfuriferula sp.]
MARLTQTTNCDEQCPLRRTLEVIGGKYTPFILAELFSGTKRFGELRRSVPGLSPKTLSEKLKELADKGIIDRISYPEVPPKVEYSLTERGTKLELILLELQQFWSEQGEEIQQTTKE